jgi:hypothetical protein
MLILPALATLFTFLYWRPHEIFEVFRPLTIYASLGFVVFGYLIDLRTGAARLKASPLLVILGALILWCPITVALKAPDNLGEQVPLLATSFLTMFFVSQGVQSLRGLRAIGWVLLAFTVMLAALGTGQGLAPTGCYLRSSPELTETANEGFDGRACTTREECYHGGLFNADYGCEHAGWLGTSSITGRVRYRGILEDPNELAWALSMGIPFAFAFYEAKKSRLRMAALVASVAVVGVCVVFTKSRSGQLSLLANLAVYFIRRYRGRGVVAAALAAIPLLLLGGRSGEDADSSSEERLGCWSEALNMFRENPLTGVGAGQFREHHYLTAHNSFLLTLAELGPIGFLLWTSAIYFAIKVTIRAQMELAGREGAEAARSLSMALLASMVGLVVSSVFLSLAYHPILWIFLGLTGSLYAAIRQHAPTFRVTFRVRDLAAVAAVDIAFVSSIAVYLHWKGI